MTTHARRFASVPARTASETWRAIVDCFDPPADERQVLEAATGALSIIIAEEVTAMEPIVLTGCGPQVRVYTVYGQHSIDGDNVIELPVAGLAFGPEWKLHVPPGDDAELIGGLIDGLHVTVASAELGADHSTQPYRVSEFDLSALE